MLGLIVIGIAFVYFIIVVSIPILISIWLSKHIKHAWLWGVMIFFVINIPLINKTLLPMAMKPYYCQEAGFTLYKTPEQWMQENPGVAGTLIRPDKPDDEQIKDAQGRNVHVTHLNQHFYLRTRVELKWNNIREIIHTVVDVKTQEVMAKRVNYSWSLPSPFRGGPSCSADDVNRNNTWIINGKSFSKYKRKFQFLGENK